MDNLFDIMDHTVQQPLHVHFDLAPPRKTISALLGPDIAKDWFHHGEPLSIDLPGFWRVDLCDYLLGQRLLGRFNIEGQMFSAGCCGLHTRLAQLTCTALCFLGFVSAVDVIADLMPTRFQFSEFARWAYAAIVRLVVGKICDRTLLVRLGLLTSLSGKARGTGTKAGIRDIGVKLLARTRLQVPFAMIIAGRTEELAFKVICPQTDGLYGGFGSLQHRRHMPIILAVAKRFGMDDDLMFGIYEGLAVVPLHDPMGRLHVRRVVSGDMTLQHCAPLAPLRFVLR
jgi:hypothetical protein